MPVFYGAPSMYNPNVPVQTYPQYYYPPESVPNVPFSPYAYSQPQQQYIPPPPFMNTMPVSRNVNNRGGRVYNNNFRNNNNNHTNGNYENSNRNALTNNNFNANQIQTGNDVTIEFVPEQKTETSNISANSELSNGNETSVLNGVVEQTYDEQGQLLQTANTEVVLNADPSVVEGMAVQQNMNSEQVLELSRGEQGETGSAVSTVDLAGARHGGVDEAQETGTGSSLVVEGNDVGQVPENNPVDDEVASWEESVAKKDCSGVC